MRKPFGRPRGPRFIYSNQWETNRMFETVLPVAQFMPGVGAPSPAGCALVLFIAASYAAGFIAIGAAIWSRLGRNRFAAKLARWMGATCFANSVLLVIYFSHVMRWDFRNPAPLLIIVSLPATLGLIASLTAIGGVRWQVAGIAIALVPVTVVCVVRDTDYRQRRDILIEAATKGDAARVRTLLVSGLSPDLTSHNTENLLVLAKNAETADVLLAAGARVNDDPRALSWACAAGNLPKVRTLLAHGADPNSKVGYSPARQAWWHHHDDVLELLRKSGARDAEKFQRATGALLRAVKAGDAAAVERRLGDEYSQDEREEALQFAAEKGDLRITSLLLGRTEARPELKRMLLLAAEHDHPELAAAMLDVLLARQAGIDRIEGIDEALSIAARRGYRDIASVIVEKQGGINAWDPDGFHPTLLRRAGARNDLPAVSMLLEMGATPNLSDWFKEERPKDPAVLKRLQDAEAAFRSAQKRK